jgi:2-C-methyl-D-erythritol 4-phosphate cytidylyltransferase
VEALGESVVVVPGERTNIKVTNPEDLDHLKMSGV